MILVLSGTSDGRELAIRIKEKGLALLTTAVTAYGGELLTEEGLGVNVGPLTKDQLVALIKDQRIQAIVDATHPYAQVISQLAIDTSRELALPYFRYERTPVIEEKGSDGELGHDQGGKLVKVQSVAQGAQEACKLGQRVFLTIGSNHLAEFLRHLTPETKVTARVLPEPKVLNKCFELGLRPDNIIAMQGPFSKEINLAMFKERQAQVLITKDSGKTGGTDDKLLAAAELGIPVVIIERPKLDYPNMFNDMNQLIDTLRLINKN
jgi:precorrin-6A/cobalt-precorrin-6A reductase